MQWGSEYRALHERAYAECYRVLKFTGTMLVNVSDHIREFRRVYVSKWHHDTLTALGFVLVAAHFVKTPRFSFGKNHDLRTLGEYVFVFQKV